MRAPKPTVENARALRRALTLPEILLWQLLRGWRLSGIRFRRQHPIGSYVLDFYCSEAKLGVEVDGAAHDHPERAARDEARDRLLSAKGISVLRFPARDLLTDDGRESVLASIAARLAAPSTAFQAVPPSPRCGGGLVRRDLDVLHDHRGMLFCNFMGAKYAHQVGGTYLGSH